ncbi:MAG: hypothetical protein ABIA63_04685, partial [bacterium]
LSINMIYIPKKRNNNFTPSVINVYVYAVCSNIEYKPFIKNHAVLIRCHFSSGFHFDTLK